MHRRSSAASGDAAVAGGTAAEGSRRLVTVRPYDPRKPYGVARLLGVVDAETVTVQFVLGRKKVCNVPSKHLAQPLAIVPSSPIQIPSAVPELPRQQPVEPVEEPAVEPAVEQASCAQPLEETSRVMPLDTPTWERLLVFGECCRLDTPFSGEGMRRLWSLFLNKRANAWIQTNVLDDEALVSSMDLFFEVWWEYCVACAHAVSTDLTHRQKLLVLELVCGSMSQANSRHSRVFAALLMQSVVVYCHEQSLCSVVADVNNVGYNFRVDKAKIGVVASAKALLKWEQEYPVLAGGLQALRDPKRVAVWLVKNKTGKFRRFGQKKLHEFPEGSRVESATGRIKIWSEEQEDYVYCEDYYTTMDAVRFKRCKDQLSPGDDVLFKGRDCVVAELDTNLPNPNRVNVALASKSGKVEELCVLPKRVFAVGTRATSTELLRALKKCPEVVDTMCLSVGNPTTYSRRQRRQASNAEMRCRVVPLKTSFREYVLWRCAAAFAGSTLSLREARVAKPYLDRARLSWLSVA